MFINEIVRKVIAELKVQQIEIIEEYSTLSPVYGEQSRFMTLVRNLCLNAVEAMPGGGQLRIKTQFLQSSGNGKLSNSNINQQVKILIADTG